MRKAEPYSVARDWLRASSRVRPKLSPQQLSDARRIARLGDARGLRLDALGASYEQLRWLAGAITSGEAETERRYLALVKLLEDNGTRRAFVALKETMPVLGRAASRAANLRGPAP